MSLPTFGRRTCVTGLRAIVVLALRVSVEAGQCGQTTSDRGGAELIYLSDSASERVDVTPCGLKRVEVVVGAPGEPLV